MQVTGDQAIIFGTRMSPEYCLIFMKTNFLDICIRCNMFSGLGAKMVPKRGEGRKGGRVVRDEGNMGRSSGDDGQKMYLAVVGLL